MSSIQLRIVTICLAAVLGSYGFLVLMSRLLHIPYERLAAAELFVYVILGLILARLAIDWKTCILILLGCAISEQFFALLAAQFVRPNTGLAELPSSVQYLVMLTASLTEAAVGICTLVLARRFSRI